MMKKRLLPLLLALFTALSLCAPVLAADVPPPEGTELPAPEQTDAPAETPVPTAGATEEPEETPVPAPEETAEPEQTEAPQETPEPTAGPEQTPEPSAEPTETPEPSPSASPEPTPDPNGMLMTILAEHPNAYTGFSGIYQQIMVGEKTVYQSDSGLMLSAEPIPDERYNAQFLPRDMGDGGYAFENRATELRIAGAGAGSALPMTLYNIRASVTPSSYEYAGMDDNTQHWVREEAGDGNGYYLRSMSTGLYMGLSEDETQLVAVGAEQRAVVTFKPLYEQSPLYLLSIRDDYAQLSDNQRARLERVYESVAGDAFEHGAVYTDSSGYSNKPKKTPRAQIDEIYKNVNAGVWQNAAWRLNNLFKQGVTQQLLSNYLVRTDLPGTEGVTYSLEPTGNGQYYDGNTMKLMQDSYIRLYKDGSLQQEIRIAIEQSETGQKNAETFAKALTHIPYVLRQHITQAKSIKGTGQLSARLDAIYVELATTSSDEGMLYQVIHELGHSQDCAYYLYLHPSHHDSWLPWTVHDGSAWSQAREADVFSPSDYGSGPVTEDFAEFCRFYFTVYSHQDWYQALRILFPARYELFKQIREEIMGGYSLFDDGTRLPEATETPKPTDTPEPSPTDTPRPADTPEPVDTAGPSPTDTAAPTNTPEPAEPGGTPGPSLRPVSPTATAVAPDTGDESPLALYAGLLVLCLGALAVIPARKRRVR